MSKSYVSLEKKICIVTGIPYETGSLLMDASLKDSFEKYTTTGWGISPEYQEYLDKGWSVCIVVDESQCPTDRNLKPEEIYRTGRTLVFKKPELFGVAPGTINLITQKDEEEIKTQFAELIDYVPQRNDQGDNSDQGI